jgi:hypothetical protein
VLLPLVEAPTKPKHCARLSRRSAIVEAQSSGALLWERRDKTAWREAWGEVRPVLERISSLMDLDKVPACA